MAEVVLHGGAIALVDDEDLQSIAQYKWYLSSHGYAVRTIHVSGNKKDGVVQRGEAMHRVVMKAVKGQQIDHINRNRLDNRKSNLRFCSSMENTWNRSSAKPSSGYVGVRKETANVWAARLAHKTLGYYSSAEKAAQARDLAALKERGSFATLNFNANELPEFVEPLPPRNTGEHTSAVVGVSFAKNRKAQAKWRVVYKKKHLGWFYTEAEAIVQLNKVKHESQSCSQV